MWRGAKTANENMLKNVAFLRTRIEFIDLSSVKMRLTRSGSHFQILIRGEEIQIKDSPHPVSEPYRLFLKDKGMIHLKTDNTELYNYTRRVVTHNKLEIHEQHQTISIRKTSPMRSFR